MSIEALNYVTRLKVGNVTAKYTLTRLADRADERYSCNPSVPLLAAELEVSERTIQRALDHLRGLRYISDRLQFRSDGSQTTSRYVLHGPWDDFGGSSVPFPEIITPRQARQELWAQAPAEGAFREGTAAAAVLKGDEAEVRAAVERAAEVVARAAAAQESKRARGRKAAAVKSSKTKPHKPGMSVSAGGGGVTHMSPPPVTHMSPPPVTPTSPHESSSSTTRSESGGAPSARSAADGRRPSTGSSARVKGGSAALRKSSPSKEEAAGSARMSREQAAAVRTVEAGVPEVLAGMMPRHRPPAVRDAILAAVSGRTVDQVVERVNRRWIAWGYSLQAEQGTLERPVGVLVRLLERMPCADPLCEDGTVLDTGAACRACEGRRAGRRAAQQARSAAAVPGQRSALEERWVCVDCERTGKGEAPADGVCRDCTAAAEAAAHQFAARLAPVEGQPEAGAEPEAAKEPVLVAEPAATREPDDETAQLRAQMLAENPWMAQYASKPDQMATAPF